MLEWRLKRLMKANISDYNIVIAISLGPDFSTHPCFFDKVSHQFCYPLQGFRREGMGRNVFCEKE